MSFEGPPDLPDPEEETVFPSEAEHPTLPPAKQEHEPTLYEKALEAARAVHGAGIKEVIGPDEGDEGDEEADPRVKEANAAIALWESERGLGMRGVGTMEKAVDLVKAATIWIDAGYADPQFLRDALERLNNEYADALREGNEEITQFLKTAIEGIEARPASQNPKEKLSAKVEARLEEARQLEADGRGLKAVFELTLALMDPDFKRMTADQRNQIRSSRDDIKARLPKA